MATIKRAIIIGGVGGLCAAISLGCIGVQAEIHEQAERFDNMGAGLVMRLNAIGALRHVDLADMVMRTGARIEAMDICSAGGKMLSHWPPNGFERLFGAPTVPIHRAELHDILLAAYRASHS